LLDYANSKNPVLVSEINSTILSEFMAIRKGFYSFFKNKFWLTRFDYTNIGKIEQLNTAKAVNLNFPETLITGNKEKLIIFAKKYSKIIIKPIENIRSYRVDDKNYAPFTKLIDIESISDLRNLFFPSLFQRYIEKEFEIRSFYFNGEIYSMAMFSQDNQKTLVDFRNYDTDKQTRRIPFKLPLDIEEKIKMFMQKLDLNTGSLDIILGKDDNFYFLEVNPVGQFGMVSEPCNYNLEKKIAEFLIDKDTEKNI
jgi:ATP-GRASP peptide maturase of grasp-with-spasm system